MTTTQSITRSLVELKRINDRIQSAISGGKFVARTVGKNSFRKVGGTTESVEKMTTKIQSSFDSVDALIDRRQKLKSAIVLSNANTKVTIGGNQMTVAEAIELKGTIDFQTQYLLTLRKQLAWETAEIEKANGTLDANIDALLTTIYGADKAKVDDTTHKSVSGPQREQKEAALLDPSGIEKKIEALSEKISILATEVDFTLSESNAMTQITIE